MKFVCLLILPVFLAGGANAQGISPQLCKEIDNSIASALKPTKVYRSDTFKNECVFDFEIAEGGGTKITIEKHQTQKESHKQIKENKKSLLLLSKLYDPPKFDRVRLKDDGHWDEVHFYKSRFPDNFMLLRKANYSIVILSARSEILLEIEKTFRRVNLHE